MEMIQTEGDKKTQQLNAIPDPKLDPVLKEEKNTTKNVFGSISVTRKRRADYFINVHLLKLITALCLCKKISLFLEGIH